MTPKGLPRLTPAAGSPRATAGATTSARSSATAVRTRSRSAKTSASPPNGSTAKAAFDAMAFRGQDGLVIGKSVKFVIDAREPSAPQIRFMNANFAGARRRGALVRPHRPRHCRHGPRDRPTLRGARHHHGQIGRHHARAQLERRLRLHVQLSGRRERRHEPGPGHGVGDHHRRVPARDRPHVHGHALRETDAGVADARAHRDDDGADADDARPHPGRRARILSRRGGLLPGSASACDEALFDVEKPRALDMEIKLFETGQFHVKQVREFSGM